jgi:hypothetical protein
VSLRPRREFSASKRIGGQLVERQSFRGRCRRDMAFPQHGAFKFTGDGAMLAGRRVGGPMAASCSRTSAMRALSSRRST